MQFLITEDVMAIYHGPGRWRHGGLQDYVKVLKKKFLLVLRIDMNQFKSIRGLMLGILPLGVNWPGEAGLTP